MHIARKYNLDVIEDASHGPLSEYEGKKLGTIGDVGCFSFFSNKNIGIGEGGMFVTNHEEYYKKAKLLRSHGMTSLSYERAQGDCMSYDVIELGYNYRIDDIRASLGIVQLGKLHQDLKKRAKLRDKYLENLAKLDQIIIPFKNRTGLVSNHIFPIILKDSTGEKRERIRIGLQNKGIQTSVHYLAVHRFSLYKLYVTRSLPKTDYVADNEITLPMYASLQESDVEYIASSLTQLTTDEK